MPTDSITATRKLSKLAARFRTDKRVNPVNVQTLTESDGKVGWGVMVRLGRIRRVGARSGGGLGKFTIAGRVIEVEGNAVADAEVMVGKTMVYTGANGEFELTVRSGGYAVEVEGGRLFQGRRLRRENQSRLL